MNPGMVVKLRPSGPWRIGPDSGARNRVDAIYHSDTLYGALTSAMAVLGSRDEWLDATARSSAPAVRFSSCFPFVDEIGFVTPPRTVWPPSSPGLMAARVRWKSARFVPLGIVQAILAGERLDDSQWVVDGPSECLLPAGRSGPFRAGVRWNAAVDRLSGLSERHSTACLEFRPGAGLWAIVSFADEAARDRWSDPVKAAFRWLADSGFGGERSRGWGRSDAPEFVEGVLPEMVLGAEKGVGGQGPGAGELAEKQETGDSGLGAAEVLGAEEGAGGQGPGAGEEPPPSEEPPAVQEPPVEQPPVQEPPPAEETVAVAQDAAVGDASVTTAPEVSAMTVLPVPSPESPAPVLEEASVTSEPEMSAMAAPQAPGSRSPAPFWLLSLFTPAADDSIDWGRGNYSLTTRGGRVDSSGALKKQLPMVAEGSVVYAASEPLGSAPDVAPDGFAHPVFRAGFAVSIPLPEAGQ